MADDKKGGGAAGNEGAGDKDDKGKAGAEGTDNGTPGADGKGDKGAAGDAGKGADDKGGDKPQDEGSDDKGGKADDGKPESKAPEKYELTVPEGGRVSPDDLKLVEQIARERGLTNEQAQAVLDDHDEQLELQGVAFLEATKADKRIGGDKLTETLKTATAALDKLHPKGTEDGDAFRALLDRTGYGNHPEVLRHFAKLGTMMQEDRPGIGSASGGDGKKSTAETMYPDMAKS